MRCLAALVVNLLFWLSVSPAFAESPNAADWPQYNRDNRGWRFNPVEKTLGPQNVAQLVEKWRFPTRDSQETIGAVHTTPVVVNGFTYVGSASTGVVYKLSPRGKLVWRFEVPRSKVTVEFRDAQGDMQRFGEGGIWDWILTNSPLVTDSAVFVATNDGQVFCLDRFSGQRRWTINARDETFPCFHIVNSFWASPILIDGKLILAGGAMEQAAAALVPDYECCSGRGFVIAVSPESGAIVWKYHLGEPPQKFVAPIVVNRAGTRVKYTHGPSTSTIWSTPSFDPESQLLYFGTDTNNSPRLATAEDARESTKHSCAVGQPWGQRLFFVFCFVEPVRRHFRLGGS